MRCVRLTWPESLALLHRAHDNHSIQLDENDGDTLLSGFELLDDGLIKPDCSVAGGPLTDDERAVYALPPAAPVQAIAAQVITHYWNLLGLATVSPHHKKLLNGLLDWIAPAVPRGAPKKNLLARASIPDLFQRAYEIRLFGASTIPAGEEVREIDEGQMRQLRDTLAPYLVRIDDQNDSEVPPTTGPGTLEEK